MLSSTSTKIGMIVALAVVVTAVPVGMYMLSIPAPTANVRVTLLYNAGVMIEANGLRIYVDPVELPANYSSYPADAVLITHDHGDHYSSSVVQMLQKQGTVNVFPKIMIDAIAEFSGTGVSPMDHIQVGSINITAFYMYTFAPVGYNASHPKESNYTSYIIDVGGYTVFHAGDSKNIPEYEQLVGDIDIALLPLGPGCQTMYRGEVVDVIQLILPKYMIPIHFSGGEDLVFVGLYEDYIASTTDCEIVQLSYFQSYAFVV